MTWRKVVLLGLVFGVSGLAYAAWRGREERERERRSRLIHRCRKYPEQAAAPGCTCPYEDVESCVLDGEES